MANKRVLVGLPVITGVSPVGTIPEHQEWDPVSDVLVDPNDNLIGGGTGTFVQRGVSHIGASSGAYWLAALSFNWNVATRYIRFHAEFGYSQYVDVYGGLVGIGLLDVGATSLRLNGWGENNYEQPSYIDQTVVGKVNILNWRFLSPPKIFYNTPSGATRGPYWGVFDIDFALRSLVIGVGNYQPGAPADWSWYAGSIAIEEIR